MVDNSFDPSLVHRLRGIFERFFVDLYSETGETLIGGKYGQQAAAFHDQFISSKSDYRAVHDKLHERANLLQQKGAQFNIEEGREVYKDLPDCCVDAITILQSSPAARLAPSTTTPIQDPAKSVPEVLSAPLADNSIAPMKRLFKSSVPVEDEPLTLGTTVAVNTLWRTTSTSDRKLEGSQPSSGNSTVRRPVPPKKVNANTTKPGKASYGTVDRKATSIKPLKAIDVPPMPLKEVVEGEPAKVETRTTTPNDGAKSHRSVSTEKSIKKNRTGLRAESAPESDDDLIQLAGKGGLSVSSEQLRSFDGNYDVSVDPMYIPPLPIPYIVGPHLVNTRILNLTNSGHLPVKYTCETAHDAIVKAGVRLVCLPRVGILDVGESARVTVHFAFSKVGSITVLLPISLTIPMISPSNASRNPLPVLPPAGIINVKIDAVVQGPCLRVDSDVIDFSIIPPNGESESRVTLFNTSDVALSYRIINATDEMREKEWNTVKELLDQQVSTSASDLGAALSSKGFITTSSDAMQQLINMYHNTKEFKRQFLFAPSTGQLPPRQQVVVNIFFTPLPGMSGSVRDNIEIQVIDSPSKFIEVRGEVQKPNVCIVPPIVELGTVYVNVPVRRIVHLKNLSILPTIFQWAMWVGDETIVTEFDPPLGTLKSSQPDLPITITFKLTKPVKSINALLPCIIQGDASNNIAVKFVSADIRTLSVSLSVQWQMPSPFEYQPELPSIIDAADPNGEVELANSQRLLLQKLDSLDSRCIEEFCESIIRGCVSRAVKERPSHWIPPIQFGTIPLAKCFLRYIVIRNHSCGVASCRVTLEEEALVINSNTPKLHVSDTATLPTVFSLVDSSGALVESTIVLSLPPAGWRTVPVRCKGEIPGHYRGQLTIQTEGVPVAKLLITAECVGSVLSFVDLRTPGLRLLEVPKLILPTCMAVNNERGMAKSNIHVYNSSVEPVRATWVAQSGQRELATSLLEGILDIVIPRTPTPDVFRIEPPRFDIPARGSAKFTITFDPTSVVTKEGHSLQYNSRFICTPCGVQSQREMDPLMLDVVGELEVPKLASDPKDKLVIKEFSISSTTRKSRTIRLINTLPCRLDFTFEEIDSPFQIDSCLLVASQGTRRKDEKRLQDEAASTFQSSSKGKSQGKFTLRSGDSLDVSVSVLPDEHEGALNNFTPLTVHNDGEPTKTFNMTLNSRVKSHNEGKSLSNAFPITRALVVNYGLYTQSIPVTVEVHFPFVQLNNQSIMFSTLSDFKYPQRLELTNLSIADAEFTIVHLPNKSLTANCHDDPSRFTFEPSSGVIRGMLGSQTFKESIEVRFQPLGTQAFQSKFEVNIRNGFGTSLWCTGNAPFVEHTDKFGRRL